jgi:hypothetical protein
VGYSEAVSLADPDVIDESVRIVRHALETYRRERARGNIADMGRDAEVYFRTRKLIDEARLIILGDREAVPDPYSAAGMYEVLASGFLAAPHLSFCRDEFEAAATQTTRSLNGGISVVDSEGSPVSARERARRATDIAMRRRDRGTIARPGRADERPTRRGGHLPHQGAASKGKNLRYCVVGAGHGGMGMAGHLAIMGYPVTLYNRSENHLSGVKWHGGITVEGEVTGFGPIPLPPPTWRRP